MVTDEALKAEIAVWPNFFLINIFFALKGSKLFIIIHAFAFHFTAKCFDRRNVVSNIIF